MTSRQKIRTDMVAYALRWHTSLIASYETNRDVLDLLLDIDNALASDTLLMPNEKELIRLLYYSEKYDTIKEVSEVMGYSSYWCGVVHKNALIKIADFLELEGYSIK